MRTLTKGLEPHQVSAWKKKANEDWKPEYANLCNPEKQLLHEQLLREQFFCCCYCGREITIKDSHIEHFRPQSSFTHLELDYQNLHASCIRQTNPETPLHCGHKKGNWFDESAYLSPLDPGCEARFRYLLNGEIQPAARADRQASQMIEILALDIAYLNNRREEILLGMFDDQFLLTASQQELTSIIEQIQRPANGSLSPFSHVVARFATQLVG